MKLTATLIGHLNRVFNKDPKRFLALKIEYAGPMTWTVADQVLSTVVQGNAGAPLSIDLTQYTVGTLAAFLAAQAGYAVSSVNGALASLSAAVLLDGTGTLGQINGDALYGFGSPLWAIQDSAALEVTTARQQVTAAPAMMQTNSAQGFWLDVIGGLYGVPRNSGEPDTAYGPRIITQTLRPANNNFAIASTLEYFTGYKFDVPDADSGTSSLRYDGSVNHIGAPYFYNSTLGSLYGAFDVIVHTGAGLSNSAFAALIATITPIINAVRAGGTLVRNITQTV